MNESSSPRPPQSEPEILPPGAAHRSSDEHVVFVEMQRSGRLPLFQPSLGTFLLAAAIVGVVAALLLVLLLGAVLLSLPMLGFVFLVVLISSVLRGQARRRR